MGSKSGLHRVGVARAAAIHCPECLSDGQLRTLVSRHGTPLLIIDCEQIRLNYRALHDALPNVSLHYAVKALPDAAVLSTLRDEGSHFDVASSGEIELLRKQGISSERALHTHPIKTELEIQAALRYGCRTFVFDNAHELEKFKPYRECVKLLLRIGFRNPDAVVDLSKKFGAAPSDAISLVKRARSLGLSTVGLSFHVGSQCASSRAHVSAIEACRGLMAAVEQARLPALRVLDIGGGFPAPYSSQAPVIETFCAPISKALKQLPRQVRVLAEPGRYLVASAGHGALSVVGKATREGAPWYYLDDGIYGSFGAQVFDGIRYPLTVLTANSGPNRLSHLAGPTCDSGDMISDGALLPELDIGDVVIAHMMGAYSCVTATDFNSVKKAKILLLNAPVPCEESGTMLKALAE